MKPDPAKFPFRLICLDETDSTNNYLTALCDSDEHVKELSTVVAELQ